MGFCHFWQHVIWQIKILVVEYIYWHLFIAFKKLLTSVDFRKCYIPWLNWVTFWDLVQCTRKSQQLQLPSYWCIRIDHWRWIDGRYKRWTVQRKQLRPGADLPSLGRRRQSRLRAPHQCEPVRCGGNATLHMKLWGHKVSLYACCNCILFRLFIAYEFVYSQCWSLHFKLELSYRKQIARQLHKH